MRTLLELTLEMSERVSAANERHVHCSRMVRSASERAAAELLPQSGTLYTRLGTNTQSKLVHIVETQITDIVVSFQRYRLDEITQPPKATLLVVQSGVHFYVRYPTERDKLALPPFHVLSEGNGEGWYSVCLGGEVCPEPQSLARVLSTVNFGSSYFQLVDICGQLGVSTVPHPFNLWANAMPRLLRSEDHETEDVPGFRLIREFDTKYNYFG